jgi:hypothetical protein
VIAGSAGRSVEVVADQIGRRRVLCVLVAGLSVVVTMTSIAVAGGVQRTASGNRQIAMRDADALFARLRLPVGAVRTSGIPAWDRALPWRPAIGPPGAPDLVDRHGWWQTSGTPQSVLAFIEAHRPSGFASSGDRPGTAGRRNLAAELVWFDWRPRPAVLSLRELEIEIVGLSNDRVGIRADAEVVWILPHPAQERISPAVRAIRITSAHPGHRPWLTRTITRRDQVRTIVSLIDRLPVQQPGPDACDAYSIRAAITLTFDGTAARDELATASQDVGPAAMPAECEPMSIAIHHRTQTPLIAGTSVLRTLERLLGTSLTRSH